MSESELKSFAKLFSASTRILVFTGAGISTASGIPDFRGPNGVWKRRRPVYYREFLSSEPARVEYWDYKLEGYEFFRNAQPNPAHRALAELERSGRLVALVTQNIDGLHEAAGNSPSVVIELHGTNRRVECLGCSKSFDPAAVFDEFRRTRRPPRCVCGGWLKPATIMFGQDMPADKLERALAAAEEADLVVSLGSTLEVQPAASVPLVAQQRGVPYVIVNQGPTAHDALAKIKLDADVSLILPSVISELKRL